MSRLAILLLAPIFAFAQQGTGTISGTVTDPQDALIAAAKVEIVNVGTSVVFRTKANEQGFSTAAGLEVGRYEVRGEL